MAILIIDDEEPIREVLRRVLERHQHVVVEAASVDEARRRLKEERFDLVLCDIRMSGESGLELLRAVAAESGDTAVVMVSGVDDPEIAEQALAMGAYGYLVKPFTGNEVLITVASALRRRELERARDEAEARERVLELIADRERIGTDLHRTVINHLFSVGLALEGALRLIEVPQARSRVLAAVEELDSTIKQIRSTIVGLTDG